MGTPRISYPSVAASASTAFPYTGDALLSIETSLLGLPSLENGGMRSNSRGILGRPSLYGYETPLYSMNGGLYHPRIPTLLAQNGVHVGAADNSRGGPFNSEVSTRSYLRDSCFPDSYTRALSVLDGSSLHTLSLETDIHSSGREFVNIAHRDHTNVKKRKAPPFDEIIRETWELHSLFRRGLPAASDVNEGHKDYIISHQNAGASELKWSSGDKGLLQAPPLDKSWDVAVNEGLLDSTTSWMELSASTCERKKSISNKRQKESPLDSDLEQGQHASDLQRLTSARVAEFIGSHSDDEDSDSELFVDSEDDTPMMITDSPGDAKTREEEAFDFFFHMFEESKELQKLFSEQCHVGRFDCLVCSTIPGKPVKKYNGLLSVVMHASKIIRTKKKQDHRGYARALCATMGWDLARLPKMPSSSSPHPRCCIPINEQKQRGDKLSQ